MALRQRGALRVPPQIAATIRNLHPGIRRKLRGALEALLADPRTGKPLKEELEGLWSLRVGRFCVIYRIDDGPVTALVAFGPRERIYEETARLLRRGGK